MLAMMHVACGSGQTRYRLPLDGENDAASCYFRCRQGDDKSFVACLETCPGIERTRDARCDPESETDRPPVAACVTVGRQQTHAATVVMLTVVTTLSLLVVLLARGLGDEGPNSAIQPVSPGP